MGVPTAVEVRPLLPFADQKQHGSGREDRPSVASPQDGRGPFCPHFVFGFLPFERSVCGGEKHLTQTKAKTFLTLRS